MIFLFPKAHRAMHIPMHLHACIHVHMPDACPPAGPPLAVANQKPEEGVSPLPMPPKKRLKCDFCRRDFKTTQGLQIHCGRMHKADHWRYYGSWKGLPAPLPPMPIAPMEDIDLQMPDLEGMDGDEAEQGAPDAGAAGEEDVDQAREYARRLLRDPSWVKWAEDTLHWCEANLLEDVGALFPAAEDFPTPETYRFLRLFHEHPGAAFASELLQANKEEQLDLSKVGTCCAFAAFAAFAAHSW